MYTFFAFPESTTVKIGEEWFLQFEMLVDFMISNIIIWTVQWHLFNPFMLSGTTGSTVLKVSGHVTHLENNLADYLFNIMSFTSFAACWYFWMLMIPN